MSTRTTVPAHASRCAVSPSHLPARPVATSDAPLLAQARLGDSEAVAELYSRHQAAMLRVAHRHAFPDYTAHDLVSEAFARMLGALANGHGPSDNAAGYLAVTVRNLSARHGRRLGHRYTPSAADDRTLHGVPDPGPGVDHQVLTEEANRDLLVALCALHPSWREVLLLTHVEELSVAEAARRLEITPAAFAALSYRARRALRSIYLAGGHARAGTPA